ncbi:hypothetical protein J6590_089162 [Homalodisca vitripennis]|nr:hypothetical protein J6590_089162 [Homalodisca vitripennis]
MEARLFGVPYVKTFTALFIKGASNRREKNLHCFKRVRSQTKPDPAIKRLLQVLTSTQERFVLVFRLLLTKPVSDKQLCSMDVDELTSQVFRRGAIWDERKIKYKKTNRSSVWIGCLCQFPQNLTKTLSIFLRM